MYSAINQLKIIDKNPKLTKPIIFLYRDICNRVISCFNNWCIKKYKNKKNWLMELLFTLENFDYAKFYNFLELKNINGAFRMFLNILRYIYKLDKHLCPQIDILINNGVNKVSHFINIENTEDIIKLEKMLNQKIPIVNKSNEEDTRILKVFLLKNKNYVNF